VSICHKGASSVDEIARERTARTVIAFATSTVVVPAGMAAAGIPWLVIFSMSLLLTVCVAAWGFPAWRGLALAAVVATGGLALWTIKHEVAYGLTFQFCRNQRYLTVDGMPKLANYWFGIRPFNKNAFDVWVKLDEEQLSLGGTSLPSIRQLILPQSRAGPCGTSSAMGGTQTR
jgi:hypothetical protein